VELAAVALMNVRCWGKSRRHLLSRSFSAFDPGTDIDTTGVIHRAAGQLGQTDCHPENLLCIECDRRTCAAGPEAEITVIRIDNIAVSRFAIIAIQTMPIASYIRGNGSTWLRRPEAPANRRHSSPR
jgi:hypothetical protein